MKKSALIISLLLVLSILFSACAGNNQQNTESSVPPETKKSDGPGPADWSSLTGQGKVGTVLPDFSTKTADGETFTLSEALKDHELVLINLWATWCPPCNTEFPFLEEAYQDYRDRVAVIALSVEESDTMSVLQKFAQEKSLSFPLGRDENYTLSQTFNVTGIPTSLLVDRNMTVLWMESGAMSSKEAFTQLFDTYLGGGAAADQSSYTVTVADEDGNVVPGCVIGFCTEESCVPIITDENGKAVFQGAPYAYHLQLLSVPEGYDYTGSDDLFVRAEGDSLSITVTKLAQ